MSGRGLFLTELDSRAAVKTAALHYPRSRVVRGPVSCERAVVRLAEQLGGRWLVLQLLVVRDEVVPKARPASSGGAKEGEGRDQSKR
jgi:hypothetical protein